MLDAGYVGITTLREILLTLRSLEKLGKLGIGLLAMIRDRPDGLRYLHPVDHLGTPHIYGVFIALPPAWPSPLAGSLLYQEI